MLGDKIMDTLREIKRAVVARIYAETGLLIKQSDVLVCETSTNSVISIIGGHKYLVSKRGVYDMTRKKGI